MQATVFFAAGYFSTALLLPHAAVKATAAGVVAAVCIGLSDVLALQSPQAVSGPGLTASLWAATVALWGALLGWWLARQAGGWPADWGPAVPAPGFAARLLVYVAAVAASVGSMLAAPLDVLAVALLASALRVGPWPGGQTEPPRRLLPLDGSGRLLRTAALFCPVVLLCALALHLALRDPQLGESAALLVVIPLAGGVIPRVYQAHAPHPHARAE
jgi:hypothetical protein